VGVYQRGLYKVEVFFPEVEGLPWWCLLKRKKSQGGEREGTGYHSLLIGRSLRGRKPGRLGRGKLDRKGL